MSQFEKTLNWTLVSNTATRTKCQVVVCAGGGRPRPVVRVVRLESVFQDLRWWRRLPAAQLQLHLSLQGLSGPLQDLQHASKLLQAE